MEESVEESLSDSDCENQILLGLLLLRRRKRNKRKDRVNPFWRRRGTHGAHNLALEIAIMNAALFREYTRMTPGQYEEVLQIVAPSLISMPTREDIINPSTKLLITLRFLSTGETFQSLSFQFRMGKSTVRENIYKTLEILWEKLKDVVMKIPKTPEEWQKVAYDFETNWQFPHCCGAMDGKHIMMQTQPHSGSLFYNYKKHHSLQLLAVCDADYKFIAIDVGGRGRESDGGVLKKSNFGKKLFKETLNLPPAAVIHPGSSPLPYFYVADQAFPLHHNIMRPYPGRATGNLPNNKRIFNYRLSRARRCIENAFGILVARFRVFKTFIKAIDDKIALIVLAATCLHNYLKMKEEECLEDERHYCPMNFTDRFENGVDVEGQWRRDADLRAFQPLPPYVGNNISGSRIREILTNFFVNEGSVPWQQGRVNDGDF